MYENDIPLRLYKYRTLAGEFGRTALEDAILHHRMHWQSPLSFNDPFDCSPVFYFADSRKQKFEFAHRAARGITQQTRSQRLKRRTEMKKQSAAHHEAVLREGWREWMPNTSVSCFSDVADHPLMWAHYADSHRGVCLIFQEQIEDDHWFAFPVEYTERRPKINLAKMNDDKNFKLSLLIKSSHWSYEREHRMILWRNPPGIKEFPRDVLRGVILGAKISAEDEVFVRQLVARRPMLELFRCQVDVTDFKLNVVPA